MRKARRNGVSERSESEWRRRSEIEKSMSYRVVKEIATIMDKYYLDGILGLVPEVGDAVCSLAGWPALYVAIFKVRSLRLTLAVVFNNLTDLVVGAIPGVGDVADFFNRSNLRNFNYIRGYVEGDCAVIEEVKRKSTFFCVGIGVIVVLVGVLVGVLFSIL